MHITWLVLSAVISTLHATRAENLHIKCCDIWSAVNQFVVVSTGEDIMPCPVPCKTFPAIAKFVMNISPMLKHLDDAHNGSTYYIPHEDIFPSDKVSDVLAWSIVGRLCSTHPSDEQLDGKFMQFEPSTGAISVVRAGCEYQRSMYSTLLGLCIIIIIFILTSIAARKSVEIEIEVKSTDHKDANNIIASSIIQDNAYELTTHGSHRMGTRADVRYRMLT